MLKFLKKFSEYWYYLAGIICSVAFIFISIPAFSMTGLIVKPLMLCIAGAMIVSFVFSFSEKAPFIIGFGQLGFVLFWLCYVIVKQLMLQYEAGWTGNWIYFFYFDKLLMIGTVWLASSLFVLFLRTISLKYKDYFHSFFSFSSCSFVLFYSFLLVYSFVLIRLEKGVYPINLIPFSTIKEYIADYSSIPYEVFMMFFGNLLYFTPLGYIFHVLFRDKKYRLKAVLFAVFPIAAFSLLEYSQFLFQNGFCEFDDMMMNSLGFWFGGVLGLLSDKSVCRLTKGKVIHLWC